MKLITEVHEDLQYIAEDKNGKKIIHNISLNIFVDKGL